MAVSLAEHRIKGDLVKFGLGLVTTRKFIIINRVYPLPF